MMETFPRGTQPITLEVFQGYTWDSSPRLSGCDAPRRYLRAVSFDQSRTLEEFKGP